jgi:hypothetical protein
MWERIKATPAQPGKLIGVVAITKVTDDVHARALLLFDEICID